MCVFGLPMSSVTGLTDSDRKHLDNLRWLYTEDEAMMNTMAPMRAPMWPVWEIKLG